MKKRIFILITFSVLFIPDLFSQQKTRIIPSLQWESHFSQTNLFSFPSEHIFGNCSIQKAFNPMQSFKFSIEPFRYKAFFCQMEEKNRARFGFFIKVHAGDYDRYYK